MATKDRELLALTDAAEAAYDRVRRVVIDRLPSPARIDLTQLDDNQQWALEQLRQAEAALAAYRARSYV